MTWAIRFPGGALECDSALRFVSLPEKAPSGDYFMKAHRKTTTWVIDDSPDGFKKARQFWHWYDCVYCGDHWEEWTYVDRPRPEYWCLICRARGTNEG